MLSHRLLCASWAFNCSFFFCSWNLHVFRRNREWWTMKIQLCRRREVKKNTKELNRREKNRKQWFNSLTCKRSCRWQRRQNHKYRRRNCSLRIKCRTSGNDFRRNSITNNKRKQHENKNKSTIKFNEKSLAATTKNDSSIVAVAPKLNLSQNDDNKPKIIFAKQIVWRATIFRTNSFRNLNEKEKKSFCEKCLSKTSKIADKK